MKTYSDAARCVNCDNVFTWIYKSIEYRRQGNGIYASQVISYGTDEEIKRNKLAICTRKILIPKREEYLVTNCPFCKYPFSFECNDDILKDLYS